MIGRPKQILILLIILLLTILVYLPVFKAGFVNLDDNGYVYDNRDLINGGLQSVTRFFTEFYVGHYLPLTMISLKIDHLLFGLNAHGYHSVNLLLHLCNIILVYLLILKLFRDNLLAIIIAVLFAVHPMHVESVAWISERKDVLYSFFMLLSLISYTRYLNDCSSKKYFYLSIVAFLLSILSKSAAVILPLILILIDLLLRRQFSKKMVFEKIPFFIIALFFAILTLYSQQVGGKGSEDFDQYKSFEKVLFAFYTFGFYIIKMIVPINLSAFHPFPEIFKGILPASFYTSIIITTLYLLLTIWLIYKSVKSKTFNPVLFGLMFYIFTISLYIYLPVGRVIVAERFSYLSYIGLFLILGVLFIKLTKFLTNQILFRSVIIIFIVIVLSLSVITHSRAKVWLNGLSLWSNVLNQYPTDPVANKSLADAFVMFRNYDRALDYYKKSIACDSAYSEAYYNMGIMNLKNSRVFQSIADFTKAVEIDPELINGYINRGNAKAQLKDFEGAIADYTLAINVNPSKPEAYVNRGSVYYLVSNTIQACNDWIIAANLGNEKAREMVLIHCK